MPDYFEQNQTLFSSDENSPANQFIEGASDFGESVADVTQRLVSFFELARFILIAIRDPLALLLVPTLDALISYLEDLKNIGAGSLTVWPWECGNLPPPIDTSKFEEGLDALAFWLSGEEGSNKKIKWNPNSGYSIIERKNNQKNKKLASVNDAIPNKESVEETTLAGKSLTLDSVRAIREFIDPQTWSGDYTQDIADALDYSRFFLNKRELTPQQPINKILESFDDPNDQLKPTGKGDQKDTSLFLLIFL